MTQVINSASGRCWSSDTYNPCPGVMEGVPSSNNYQGGFGTALMAKVLASSSPLISSNTCTSLHLLSLPSFSLQDLGLAQAVANSTKTATPLGALSLQLYRLMCQSGYAGKDFSSVFKFIEDQQQN